MSALETALIFGGIPIGVTVIVFVLVYATGGRPTPRYRPGRPYNFTPVWYLAPQESEDHQTRELQAHRAGLVLPAGEAAGGPARHHMVKGGARGSW